MHEKNWTAWPLCTQCGLRRPTVCPICGTAGDQFDLADFLAAAEPLRESRRAEDDSAEPHPDEIEILLLCPQCDEVFAPQFYRRCSWCGYDQQDGLESRRWHIEPLSSRELLTIYGLILGGVLLMSYFWLLFRTD